MTLFVNEIVTPPALLPVTVDAAQDTLARAVVDELERMVLWRAIVSQERRIRIDPCRRSLRLSPCHLSCLSQNGLLRMTLL